MTSPVTNPASILFLPTGPSIYPAAGSRSDPRRAAPRGVSFAAAGTRGVTRGAPWARMGVGDAVRAESGSVRWRVRAQEFAIARSRRSDVKKRERARVNSAHHSYCDRIRLLDKMCSLYGEKKNSNRERERESGILRDESRWHEVLFGRVYFIR